MSTYDDILYQYELKNIAELYTKHKILHYYLFIKYKRRYNNFNLSTIPVNIYLNLFQNYSFYKDYFPYFSYFIGVNIIANIIIKTARFLRDIELTVNHRILYIRFRKLITDINLELALPPTERNVNRSKSLLELCKNQASCSTLISKQLINKFDIQNNDSSDIKYKITSLTKQPKK